MNCIRGHRQSDSQTAEKRRAKLKNLEMGALTVREMQEYYDTVSPKVDTKQIYQEFKSNWLFEESTRLQTLRRGNMLLVSDICEIQQRKNPIRPYIRLGKDPRAELLRKQIIERDNVELCERIKMVQGFLPTTRQLEQDWKITLEKLEKSANYPLILPGLTNDLKLFKGEERRPRILLEFSIRNFSKLGSLVISLFDDLMPKTTRNFLKLCENLDMDETRSKSNAGTSPNLTGAPVHRIFPNLYLECGDTVTGKGITGRAAEGCDFFPDKVNVCHSYEGTISMIPNEKGKINSFFTISFKPLEVLNGRRPAFGRVIKGFNLLRTIECYGSRNGKTNAKIYISRCAIIHPGYC